MRACPRAELLPVIALWAGCSVAPPDSMPSTMAPPTIPPGARPVEQPPAHTVGGFGVTLPSVTLQPGQEKFACYALPVEMRGPSRLIGGAVMRNTRGVHHGNITSRPSTGSGIRTCSGGAGLGEAGDVEAGGSVLFGSSTQVDHDEWEHFPDGMAYRLREGNEVVARIHYLNATPEPLEVSPSYEWFTVDESTLEQELAPFLWKYGEFTIPARSDFTARGECDFTEAMHVVSVLPHMHRMGRVFQAGFVGGPLDGKQWLDSKGYDPERGVMQVYDPAVDLSQGASTSYSASFSCTWHNDLDFDVYEGVGDNEMCMLFGYAWPPGAAYTVLAGEGWCQKLSGGGARP